MKNFRKREIIIGPCNSSWNSNWNSKISKQTLLIEALSSLIKFLVNSFERKLDSILNLCWMLTISHWILFFLLLIVGSNLRTRVVVIAIFNASTVTKLDICNLIARRRIFATITKNQAILFLNADCWKPSQDSLLSLPLENKTIQRQVIFHKEEYNKWYKTHCNQHC